MVKKRRNHGRKGGRNGRGKARAVNCDGCGGKPRKDKAVQRYLVKNLVEAAALRDMGDASCIENYVIPKQYMKIRYCISCAVHRRTVRARPKAERRVRSTGRPPRRPLGEGRGGAGGGEARGGAGGGAGAGVRQGVGAAGGERK